MGSNKLTTLEKNIPLRAYPEELLNKAIIVDFLPYLTKLLSLTDEVSADRLEMALPAIKEQCIGMGFSEIVKMFEYYVDGNLSIKPIPNYFDRILLGKIVSEYKFLNRKPKVVIENTVSDQEKKRIDNEIVNKCLDYFIENRFVDVERLYVYDILYADNWLPTNNEYKKRIYKDAVDLLKIEYSRIKPINIDEKREIKNNLKSLLNPRESKAIVKSKELVLSEFLRKLTRDEKKLNEFKLKYK